MTKPNFDRRKSLERLEEHDWGEPNFDSYLVQTCHRLHRKPLQDFTVGDLRIMIGQQLCLSRLIYLALEQLEDNPLAEGDFYPGDLLSMVLKIDKSFWNERGDLLKRLHQVIVKAKEILATHEADDHSPLGNRLAETPRWWGV